MMQQKTNHNGTEFLDYISKQVFVVDPRAQGFGLQDYEFLDGYANKFFPLAGKDSIFVSPKAVPAELLDYYRHLDLDFPSEENIITISSAVEAGPVSQQLSKGGGIASKLKQGRGRDLIPYMATPETDALAREFNLGTLATAQAARQMANKQHFQQELATVADDIRNETGFDVAIPNASARAGNRRRLNKLYTELSDNGTKDLVVVKPESASALGIFVLRANRGAAGLTEILRKEFDDEEAVMLEEFIEHNHSPSMQGARTASEPYRHHYFDRQLIFTDGAKVSYDGNQIPFGPETVPISNSDLDRIRDIHEVLGERLVKNKGIAGVAGFDLIIQADPIIRKIKVTEMNLHLPGSYAVYAAINKVFTDGFRGFAHNIRVPLNGGTNQDFIMRYRDILVSGKNQYGVFPINMSYDDKVDVVFFAKNQKHLQQMLDGIDL